MNQRTATVGAAQTWGLFVAWVIHDSEELLTMPAWSQHAAERLPRYVPTAVKRALPTTRSEAGVAIGVMATLVAAAAASGQRTGGESRYYQAMLAGLGWHTVTHVASAAMVRGYTPGLVTAPLVAAPFSWWAWRRLARAGVPLDGKAAIRDACVLFPVALGVCHGSARLSRLVGGRHGER